MDNETAPGKTIDSATILSWLGTNDEKQRAQLVAFDQSILQPLSDELFDSLVKVLTSDEDHWRRCDAAMLLGRMGSKQATEPLRQAVNNDQVAWVRNIAANALGDLMAREAIDDLLKLLRDPEQDAMMRSTILLALGKIGDPVILPNLMEMINNIEDASLCANAVDIIRNVVKSDEAITIYLMLLNHETDYIRAEAARALGYVATRPIAKTLRDIIVTNLIKALSDRGRSYHYHGYVCNEAARSLSLINTPEAVNALERWKEMK